MTTVAEEDVLTAAELDLAVEPLAEETEAAVDAVATPEPSAAPFLQILRGSPSDAEIAALVCVFAAAAGGSGDADSGKPRELWGRPTQMHRGASPFSPYSFPALSRLR
ncbi:acyl-CoA carboxylase subunit epsilon [Nocardia higoensis]|uniref:Acyl-CoA carboxylase subunit epsilon n=1 Tax=Nocardia higoensis TaxID=228599 RepID=A0ABS0DCW6_9NOCA|nr:acyl-CoA carboxylase subunit epsilon [Nocardia higoensis]MBF6356317.1 acyl-CoA carboxylase subunit epsilon [Nocardia higoensis]